MDMQTIKGSRILTQDFVPNTNAYALLNANAKRKMVISLINVVNTSGSTDHFSLYLGKGANTYANTTALAFNQSLTANSTVQIDFGDTGLPLGGQTSDHLAFQAGNANVFCVTVIGVEL